MCTIGQVDQVESLGRRRVANLLEPYLSGAFSMASIVTGKKNQQVSLGLEQVSVPVEHNPLRNSNDAFLRVVQSR